MIIYYSDGTKLKKDLYAFPQSEHATIMELVHVEYVRSLMMELNKVNQEMISGLLVEGNKLRDILDKLKAAEADILKRKEEYSFLLNKLIAAETERDNLRRLVAGLDRN